MTTVIRRTGIGLMLAMLVSAAATAAPPALPKVGDMAPDFRLPDQDGKWHALSDYRGHWVVLYFYPKDGTPGCTTEARGIRDDIDAFRKLGTVVLGVSVDDVAAHKDFAAEQRLPFTILADAGKKVTERYGVLTSYLGMMELARRDTFIIDPQGRIVRHFVKVDPKGHSEMVLAALRELGVKPVDDKAG